MVAPVNDTLPNRLPSRPLRTANRTRTRQTAKQSEDIEPAANDQHIETEPQTSLQVSEPVPPPGRAASPNPPASLGLLPATPPLRPKPRPLPRTQQPDEERDPFRSLLRRRQAPTAGMRVQPVADEDELEELVKGREDRDEDELPDIPREDAEEEDWDIDLPAQDAAGAYWRQHTRCTDRDSRTTTTTPLASLRDLCNLPSCTFFGLGHPSVPPVRILCRRHPPVPPARARSFSVTPTRSQAPDVDATGRATRPSLLAKSLRANPSAAEHERGPAVVAR
ncbi:hypothetical protein B0H14DRAFT_3526961 [Mycena olivaceomarginata]|nr:hypothetical protein B0H14DRAFT_3526961 [Mycena olivaceomarginata]